MSDDFKKLGLLNKFLKEHRLRRTQYTEERFSALVSDMSVPQCSQLLDLISSKIDLYQKQTSKYPLINRFFPLANMGGLTQTLKEQILLGTSNTPHHIEDVPPEKKTIYWDALSDAWVCRQIKHNLCNNPKSKYHGMTWTPAAANKLAGVVNTFIMLPDINADTCKVFSLRSKTWVHVYGLNPRVPLSPDAILKLQITITTLVSLMNLAHDDLRSSYETDRDRMYPAHREKFHWCEYILPDEQGQPHAFTRALDRIEDMFGRHDSPWWVTIAPEVVPYLVDGQTFAMFEPFPAEHMERLNIGRVSAQPTHPQVLSAAAVQSQNPTPMGFLDDSFEQ